MFDSFSISYYLLNIIYTQLYYKRKSVECQSCRPELGLSLLPYNGQRSADEVKQMVMTHHPFAHPTGTSLVIEEAD